MSFHHKQPLGRVYFAAGKTWRRGVGILYAAHPSSPFLDKKYHGRLKKTHKVSPSQSRFNRRHGLATKREY